MTPTPLLSPPRGLAQIKAAYGDPVPFIGDDGHVSPEWERQILGVIHLPAPLVLGWAPGLSVNRIRVHVAILRVTHLVLTEIHRTGLWPCLKTFDGAYNFR